MLGRLATYALPLVVVGAVGFVLLGPGAARSVAAARVYGVPVESGGPIALRVRVARSAFGIDDALAGEALEVAVASGDVAMQWRGESGPDGVAEVQIAGDRPLRRFLDLTVRARGDVLASGRIALLSERIRVSRPQTLSGTTSGDLGVRVELPRGTLAAPFPGAVRAMVRGAGGTPIAGAVVRASATGADVTPESIETGPSGVISFEVKPLFHEVDLTLDARDASGLSGHWEGTLPVAPGAMAVRFDRERGALEIVAPVPRERAYLSLFTEQGRVFGASPTMTRDAAGFFVATVALPPSAAASPMLYAIVASDPEERGAGTAAWPLVPEEASIEPRRLALLLDGMPQALAREETRVRGVRAQALGVIGVSALLEVLLLVRLNRAAAQHLRSHLTREQGDGDLSSLDKRRPWTGIALIGLVALAFAVMAVAALR